MDWLHKFAKQKIIIKKEADLYMLTIYKLNARFYYVKEKHLSHKTI